MRPLREKWANLRKRLREAPTRSPLSRHDATPRRLKRFLSADDIADIAQMYEVGDTTEQIGDGYGMSKARVATVLRECGVTLRRQGLTDEQVNEAAELYAAGRSLAWLGSRYDVSHTTIAYALRRQGVLLRPRPGWI